jgi:nickel-dependent lactate racemase
MANAIDLPQLAWHGVKKLSVDFPVGWRVDICNFAGYDRPKLKPAEIEHVIDGPVGMAPLREYARGKKEVVIIFDDLSRVTRVAEIVPHVLAELATAGINDKQIRFIAASGCHGAMNRYDFVKKLGEEVLKRFPVYNHSPFDNCVYIGTTGRGIKLYLNAEFMKCDLKIGIGSIVPHIMAGFGGGGKIVLPGVAAYETILALHVSRTATGELEYKDAITGMGAIKDNPRRRDINEAAIMAGLDMKIDALVNGWGETVELFAGAPGPEYAAALEAAQKHYLTPSMKDGDVVIANTFAKANEAVSGLLVAFPSVRQEGGDVVLIANAPEGQMTHYLMGPFGNEIGGKLQLRMKIPGNVNRLIIYSEYPELASRNYLEDDGKVIMMHDWTYVMKLLEENHGSGTKAVVYPNADMQYCAD